MARYRTHTCNDLREADVGAEVLLAGWLGARRDHGHLLFAHLRDWFGTTQLVVDDSGLGEELSALSLESVISVKGTVRHRPAGQENQDLDTGEIEVVVSGVTILNAIDRQLPFSVEKFDAVNEELRLRYRYLDLRRPKMAHLLRERNLLSMTVRDVFSRAGFLEVQTPILSNSSPEGARDFLVPSRLHPGHFFALPQAPQQWKQLLMASGVDRYFQIAPCFRDEPARADRSPGEFYQVDIEMAFVEQDDVLNIVEDLLLEVARERTAKSVTSPFPRLTYSEALERFGSDKPDTRFGLELRTVTALFEDSSVGFLRDAVVRGDAIRALLVDQQVDSFSRRDIDALRQVVQEAGVSGLAWLAWQGEQTRGSLAGPMPPSEQVAIRQRLGVVEDGLLLLVAGPRARIDVSLSAVRLRIGDKLGMRDPETLQFVWVTDFPMYEWDEDTQSVAFSHNPFSMPKGGLQALRSADPLSILGYQYDLVCNGVEISSGAIRNSDPETLFTAFEIAGYDRVTVNEQFGHMIEAFALGCPPHGGIAPGFDRLLMLFTGESVLREIVPFPKNQSCQDLLVRAPSSVDPEVLRELGLQLRPSA